MKVKATKDVFITCVTEIAFPANVDQMLTSYSRASGWKPIDNGKGVMENCLAKNKMPRCGWIGSRWRDVTHCTVLDELKWTFKFLCHTQRHLIRFYGKRNSYVCTRWVLWASGPLNFNVAHSTICLVSI